MARPIKITKGRTKRITLNVGVDVSGDTFTSQIRADKNPTSDLLATWAISFATDGTDGELVLTLDNSLTTGITHTNGYMDVKRMTGGEPVDVFDDPLPVVFQEPITP